MRKLFISEYAINNAGKTLHVKTYFNYTKLKDVLCSSLLPSSIPIDIEIYDKNKSQGYLYARLSLKENTDSASLKIIEIVSFKERVGNATIMLHYLLKTMAKMENLLSMDGFIIRFTRIHGCLSPHDKASNWEKSLPFYKGFAQKNHNTPTSRYNLKFNLYYNEERSIIEDFIKNAYEGYFEYIVSKKEDS